MKRKLQATGLFLLFTVMCSAQINYDTMLVMRNFNSLKYPDDNIDWYPVTKWVRHYDEKGRLSLVHRYAFYQKAPNTGYLYYQETYHYGANDSLTTIFVHEIPIGDTKFKLKALWDYTYAGNLLKEMLITKFAHSNAEQLENKKQAFEWRKRGGSVSDTSGFKTIEATRYSYDDRKRLIKKAVYKDYTDKDPVTMWLYTYDNELPEINSYYQNAMTLHTVYSHLYKNDRLVIYRDETRLDATSLELDTHTYTYNKNWEPTGLEVSHSKMSAKKSGEPFKKDGKEDFSLREEYMYKDGRLSSKVVHYKSSYTKYKLNFLDRLDYLPSVSTSSTRYGDYSTTTTTTTYNSPPPPKKEDMIAKTKHKWLTQTSEYEYDANGKQKVKGSPDPSIYENTGKTFDSKGRLKQYETCEYDQYSNSECTRYLYRYRVN